MNVIAHIKLLSLLRNNILCVKLQERVFVRFIYEIFATFLILQGTIVIVRTLIQYILSILLTTDYIFIFVFSAATGKTL